VESEGAADKAVLNTVHRRKKKIKNPFVKISAVKNRVTPRHWLFLSLSQVQRKTSAETTPLLIAMKSIFWIK
jgi:hypothetical protein